MDHDMIVLSLAPWAVLPAIVCPASQSSQLFSTVSRTRLVYSLRLSLYRLLASTLAGLEVFGSLSRLSSHLSEITLNTLRDHQDPPGR